MTQSWYMRSLMFVPVLMAALSAQTQTPPQIRVTENVTVSARDAKTIAFGTVTPCGGHDSGLGYTAGATFWNKRFLGV